MPRKRISTLRLLVAFASLAIGYYFLVYWGK